MATSCLGGCIFLQVILIYHHCGVQSCRVEVKQNESSEALVDQKTVNVSCHYETSKCRDREKIYWFRYLESSTCERLKQGGRFSIITDTTTKETLLKIENIKTRDSGIYICVIAFPQSSNASSTTSGPGTMLIIRDKPDEVITPANIALIVLCTVLFLYCIAVLSYYSYKSKWAIWRHVQNKRSFTTDTKKTFKTRSMFQAIAAEYHKRYDARRKKEGSRSGVTEDDRIYQNMHDLH